MSDVQKFAVGDDVKIYEWSPDTNKPRIRVGRITQVEFKNQPYRPAQLYLDVNFRNEVVRDILAETVRCISDPFYQIGNHVRLFEMPVLDKFSKIGTIIDCSIDDNRKRVPTYKIRAIDRTVLEEISEEELIAIGFDEFRKACKEYLERPRAVYGYDTGYIFNSESKDNWIKADKNRLCGTIFKYYYDDETAYVDPDKISNHFDLFMTKERNNNMPPFSNLTVNPYTFTISSSDLRNINFSGSLEKETTKESEKKSEAKAPHYVPYAYKVKRIIYNDPATIVFWNDGTKTVVKRGENEKFNKYTAFCAALAKKMYGNNSQVNKIVNSGLDETEKRARKSAAKKVENKKPVKREIHVNSIHSDENWFHLIRKVTTRFTKQDIREKDVRFIVEQIKNYYESNKTIRDIAQMLGVSESSVKATLKDMRDILGR